MWLVVGQLNICHKQANALTSFNTFCLAVVDATIVGVATSTLIFFSVVYCSLVAHSRTSLFASQFKTAFIMFVVFFGFSILPSPSSSFLRHFFLIWCGNFAPMLDVVHCAEEIAYFDCHKQMNSLYFANLENNRNRRMLPSVSLLSSLALVRLLLCLSDIVLSSYENLSKRMFNFSFASEKIFLSFHFTVSASLRFDRFSIIFEFTFRIFFFPFQFSTKKKAEIERWNLIGYLRNVNHLIKL